MAATAAQKLIAGKKCSELSQPEIQAMADADAAGKMTLHPELAKNLGLRGTGARSASSDPFKGIAAGQPVEMDGKGGIVGDTGTAASGTYTVPTGGGMPKWVVPRRNWSRSVGGRPMTYAEEFKVSKSLETPAKCCNGPRPPWQPGSWTRCAYNLRQFWAAIKGQSGADVMRLNAESQACLASYYMAKQYQKDL